LDVAAVSAPGDGRCVIRPARRETGPVNRSGAAARAIIATVAACGILAILAARGPVVSERDQVYARIRVVCDQYASLDLAGLAPLCVEAGYQQVVETGRVVQPEDLGR
jgi:hypothetical protein